MTAVSIDSVWLRHCIPPEHCARHVCVVTGRATMAAGRSKVFACVGKQVRSRAARLDHFLLWHGKGRKAIARPNRLHSALEAWPEHWSSRLAWNVRIVRRHLEMNKHYLVNYGARYRKGLPISSGIAESAVNQVASHRIAKKQQMRWSDEAAHCIVPIRVADINGELSPQSLAAIPKTQGGAIPLERQRNALRMAA